jgi:D-alanyl-D-alanine carboxypeptidase
VFAFFLVLLLAALACGQATPAAVVPTTAPVATVSQPTATLPPNPALPTPTAPLPVETAPLPPTAEPAWPPAAALEAFLAAEAEAGHFMGTVLVGQGSEILFNQGYGAANLTFDVANGAVTRYRLGGLSQSYVAVAILRLAEQGQLDLHTPVSQYLPDLPLDPALTVQHLLSHSSGIPDFSAHADFLTVATGRIEPVDLLAGMLAENTLFAPGERYGYSLTNYYLLSYLIEVSTGQPLAEALVTLVWEPAGLNATGYDDQSAIVPARAEGYRQTSAGLVPAAMVDASFLLGAGAIYADSRDLWLWNQAVRGSIILQDNSREQLFTPSFFDPDTAYSFGWQFDTFLGQVRQQLHGDTFGYAAQLAYYPATDLTVVVLSNQDQASVATLADQVAALSWDRAEELAPYAERRLDPLDYAAYAGHYEVEPELILEILLVEGRLYAQGEGGEPVALQPVGPAEFLVYGAGLRATFVRNATGEVTSLTINIEGEETIAPKID